VVGTRAGALAQYVSNRTSAGITNLTDHLPSQANEDANKLQAEQKHLTAALSSHEHSIEALESELSCLDTSRHDHAEAIALLEKLQAQTSRFRANVQENLDQARNTKLYLNKTKLKLADIIQKLHECQYEETRRGIAARLREVLTMIQSGPSQKMTTSGPEKVRKAMEYLIEIDQRTVQVVDILTMH
jgi:chromosome segregation ATPase